MSRAIIDRLVVKGFGSIQMVRDLLGGDDDLELCFGFNFTVLNMHKRNQAYFNTLPQRKPSDRVHRSGPLSEKETAQSHAYVASSGKWAVAVPKQFLTPLVRAIRVFGDVPVSPAVSTSDNYFLQGGTVSCRLKLFLIALRESEIPLEDLVFVQVGEVTDVDLRARKGGVDPSGDILARSGLEIDVEAFISKPRGRALDALLQQAPFTRTRSAKEAGSVVYESAMLSFDLKCLSTTSTRGVPLFGVVPIVDSYVTSSRVYPTASAAQFLMMAAECRRMHKTPADVARYEAQLAYAGTVRFYHRRGLQHKNPAGHDTQSSRAEAYRAKLERTWRELCPDGEPMDPDFDLGYEVLPDDMDHCSTDVYIHDNTTGAKNDYKLMHVMKESVGTFDKDVVKASSAQSFAQAAKALDESAQADPEVSALITRTSLEGSFIVRTRPGLGVIAVLMEGFRRIDLVIPSIQRFDFPLGQYRRYQTIVDNYACGSSVLSGRVTAAGKDLLSEAGSDCVQAILNAHGVVPYTSQAGSSRRPSLHGVLKMLKNSSVDSLSYLEHVSEPAEEVRVLPAHSHSHPHFCESAYIHFHTAFSLKIYPSGCEASRRRAMRPCISLPRRGILRVRSLRCN